MDVRERKKVQKGFTIAFKPAALQKSREADHNQRHPALFLWRCLSVTQQKVNPPHVQRDCLFQIYLGFYPKMLGKDGHTVGNKATLWNSLVLLSMWESQGANRGWNEPCSSAVTLEVWDKCISFALHPFVGHRPHNAAEETAPSKDRHKLSAAQGKWPLKWTSWGPLRLAFLHWNMLLFASTIFSKSEHQAGMK